MQADVRNLKTTFMGLVNGTVPTIDLKYFFYGYIGLYHRTFIYTLITCSNFLGCSSTLAARKSDAAAMVFRWNFAKLQLMKRCYYNFEILYILDDTI